MPEKVGVPRPTEIVIRLPSALDETLAAHAPTNTPGLTSLGYAMPGVAARKIRQSALEKRPCAAAPAGWVRCVA